MGVRTKMKKFYNEYNNHQMLKDGCKSKLLLARVERRSSYKEIALSGILGCKIEFEEEVRKNWIWNFPTSMPTEIALD